MARKSKYTKEMIDDAVGRSYSFSEVLKNFGLKNTGGNYRNIKKWIKYYSPDTSHFVGMGWAKGKTSDTCDGIKNNCIKRKISDELVFCKNSLYAYGPKIIKRLVDECGWEYRCNNCGISEWLEKKITLELDHKNGDHTDNSKDNLRLLCPNCHSQTENYAGKRNRKEKTKVERKKREIVYKKGECLFCKNIFILNRNGQKFCGNKCYQEFSKGKENICCRKVKERPSKEVLLKELSSSNFCAIGKKYGVSDNCIRKWIK